MSTEDNIKRMIGAADVETRADEAEWNQFARKAHGALFMRRAGIALGGVALIAIGFFGAATLMNDTTPELQPAPPAGPDSASPAPTTTENTEAPPEETRVEAPNAEQELWYVKGEKLSWTATMSGGRVRADVPAGDPVAQAAAFWLEFQVGLVLGAVQEAGETTAIPDGTEVLAVHREGEVLFVDLSSEFESGGGSLSMQLRVAQIVYTATQFEGVESVRILIEGEEVDAIGGEGLIVSTPLTRRDFQDVAPNIVLESPRPNEEFSSGDLVTGFANVFEANVAIELRFGDGKGPNGKYETFTTATCGSGCWGDFTHALDFPPVSEPMEARLTVLTYSAEDGSPQDQISIPVMLVP
jgi:hypothetical protein